MQCTHEGMRLSTLRVPSEVQQTDRDKEATCCDSVSSAEGGPCRARTVGPATAPRDARPMTVCSRLFLSPNGIHRSSADDSRDHRIHPADTYRVGQKKLHTYCFSTSCAKVCAHKACFVGLTVRGDTQ